jgi:hypothetical protein
MDMDLQQSHPRAGTEAVSPALLFQLSDDDPQVARIAAAQQLLFPPPAPCAQNWA